MMPGKQMAIDADLNAGLIGEEEAPPAQRHFPRSRILRLHGRCFQVRPGDAVAGIIIMLLNVVGGLIVGVMQHNMELAQAAKNYTLLTIGDGLVAQIPGLIVSIAAGMVVTRVSDDRDIGQQVMGQMFRNPKAIGITAAIVGFLGLIPGMPNLVFLLLASTLGWFA
jgi:flagellar biosynthesis protein FlhA